MNINQNIANAFFRKLNLAPKLGEFHRRLVFLLGPNCIYLTFYLENRHSVSYIGSVNGVQVFWVIVVYWIHEDGLIRAEISDIMFKSTSRIVDFPVVGPDDVYMVDQVILELKMGYLSKRAEELDIIANELQDSMGQFGFDDVHDGIMQSAIFDLTTASAKIKSLTIRDDD